LALSGAREAADSSSGRRAGLVLAVSEITVKRRNNRILVDIVAIYVQRYMFLGRDGATVKSRIKRVVSTITESR
jgi:hypothetical protein